MRARACFTTEELADYSVGKGSGAWRHRVEEHLSRCSSCASEMAALEAVGDLVKQATKTEVPDLWHEIEPRLTPRKRPWFGAWFPTSWRRYAAAATGTAIIAAAALLWQVPLRQPAQQTSPVRMEHTDSHVTMRWSDPFADRVSLAVIDSKIEGQTETR